jgi:hypothetical protein
VVTRNQARPHKKKGKIFARIGSKVNLQGSKHLLLSNFLLIKVNKPQQEAAWSGASTTLPRSTHGVLCSDVVTGRRQIIGVATAYGHEGYHLKAYLGFGLDENLV